MSSYSSSPVSLPATPSEWLTIAEASAEYRLHPNTLRKWDKLGKLKAYRVQANTLSHRRFRRVDLDAFLGKVEIISKGNSGADSSEQTTSPVKVILCARVSTSKQSEDLGRQIKRLESFAAEKWGNNCTLTRYVRTASGLNYQNKTFVRMVQDIVNNKFNGGYLIITYKERLIRFGYDLLKAICEAHHVTIIQTETEEERSYIQELTEDILAITHIASCKLYGRRGTRKSGASNARALNPATIDEVNEMCGKGYSIRTIFSNLQKAGKNLDAEQRPFSIQVVRRLVRKFKAETTAVSLANKPTKSGSFTDFIKTRLLAGGAGSRVKRSKILAAYKVHCEANGLKKVSRKLAYEQLAAFTKNLNVQVSPCGEDSNDRLFTGLNFFEPRTGPVSNGKQPC